MGILGVAIKAVERGWVPDAVIRAGIRRLCRKRLMQSLQHADSGWETEFLSSLSTGPVALVPDRANQQHYEVPAEFYQLVLGPKAKYSSCFYREAAEDLASAETAALEITCQRAGLAEGQNVLELGCGWGSLSTFMAAKYRSSEFTAISNSSSQREHIEAICRKHDLRNLKVITADINQFQPQGRFDRVVSVEMFEHMRNYAELLSRIASWLKPDGKLFVHIFCHREFCYPFETGGDANWMAKYFFTGGLMPSQNIFQNFEQDLVVAQQYRWSGLHYQRTLDHWLANMDKHRLAVLEIFAKVYGDKLAAVWFHRWRLFFMACSELFGFNDGNEWFVSHYLLSPVRTANEKKINRLDGISA